MWCINLDYTLEQLDVLLLEEFLSALRIFHPAIICQVQDPIHLLSLVEVVGDQENYLVSEERSLLYLGDYLRGDTRIKGA